MNLLDIWNQMSFFAKAIAGVLFVMSMLSIGVAVERIYTFIQARKQSKLYAPQVAKALKEGRLKDAIALSTKKDYRYSHLAKVVLAGLQEYQFQQESGAGLPPRRVVRLRARHGDLAPIGRHADVEAALHLAPRVDVAVQRERDVGQPAVRAALGAHPVLPDARRGVHVAAHAHPASWSARDLTRDGLGDPHGRLRAACELQRRRRHHGGRRTQPAVDARRIPRAGPRGVVLARGVGGRRGTCAPGTAV